MDHPPRDPNSVTPEARATVLIIDDEPNILELVATRLEMTGYDTVCAGNAQSALRLISARPIDLALVDIHMPGMDGLALCRLIRRTSDLPVIFLTSMGAEQERTRAMDVGAEGFITKPFDQKALVRTVGEVLRAGRRRESWPMSDGKMAA